MEMIVRGSYVLRCKDGAEFQRQGGWPPDQELIGEPIPPLDFAGVPPANAAAPRLVNFKLIEKDEKQLIAVYEEK